MKVMVSETKNKVAVPRLMKLIDRDEICCFLEDVILHLSDDIHYSDWNSEAFEYFDGEVILSNG